MHKVDVSEPGYTAKPAEKSVNDVIQQVKPKLQPVEKKLLPWYDLARLLPYKDLIGALGFVCVLVSIAHYNLFISIGVGGIVLVYLAYLMGMSS